MRILYRGLVFGLAICLILQVYPYRLAFAGLPGQSSQNKPNMISSSEEDYSAAGNADQDNKVSHKWLWTILTVAAIGAAFGMGGGSGGDGGHASNNTSGGADGTITAGW